MHSLSKHHGLQLNAIDGSSFSVDVDIHFPHLPLISASLAKQVSQEKWETTAQYYTKMPKQVCPKEKQVCPKEKHARCSYQGQNY